VSRTSFWRELMLRAGTMLIVAAVAHFFLRAGAWIWLTPAVVAGAVVLKRVFYGQEREDAAYSSDSSASEGATAAGCSGGDSSSASGSASQPSTK